MIFIGVNLNSNSKGSLESIKIYYIITKLNWNWLDTKYFINSKVS